jgi:iron complex outermembrane receptor protein
MSTDLSDGLNGDGSRTRDAWIDRNAGFRLDQGEEDSGKLLVTGNIYNNVNNAATEGETTSPPYIDSINTNFPDSGWNLMGHWEKMGSDGSTVSAEVDDDSSVHFVLPYAKADSDATNIDVQDSLAKMGQHSIIVGAGYRNETTAAGGLYLLGTQSFTNDELTLSGFIQDQIAFSKSLTAQIGSKFEHENFTGWEYEPSIHLGYSPDDQHTLWASASRAVRIPTLADLGFQVNAGAQFVEGGTLLTEFLTSSTIKDSEIVTAYEAGYRAQVTNDVLFDFSTYYNQYSQLIGVGNVGNPSFSPGPPPGLVAFVTPTDLGGGHTYGGEAVSHVTLTPTWRINLGYSYLNGETPDSLFDSQLNAPQNQFEVQSYQNLTKTLDFDSAVYFVEAVPQLAVGSYTKLDLRLGLQATKRCSISVGGNNLLQNHYYQFGTVIGGSTFEVQREFYTKVEWKF